MTRTVNGVLTWNCPQCKRDIYFPNPLALGLAKQAGGCQGCRAKATFEKNPGLIELFADFWDRTSYPQSSSWTEVVPVIA